MLRRVKMCTVQCQFDVMCASIVLEPRKMRTTTLHHTTPSVGMVFHGPLYVSIFPFHNPRLVSKFNQSTIAQPFEKKTKKKNIKKNPSPPHHNKLPKSHIFHMEIWKKSRAPWLLLQQRDLLRRRRRRHGPQELCLTKSCKEASSDVFFKACEWETHDNYLGYIIYYYILHVYNSPILFEYKGTVR